MNEPCARNDLVQGRTGWMLWGVPGGVLVIGSFLEPFSRMLLWTPALVVMGVACLANAKGCGRLHCFLTGPLYLGLALVTVLRGTDVLTLPWVWIAVGVVGGTFAAYIPEWIRG